MCKSLATYFTAPFHHFSDVELDGKLAQAVVALFTTYSTAAVVVVVSRELNTASVRLRSLRLPSSL